MQIFILPKVTNSAGIKAYETVKKNIRVQINMQEQ